jgi:hypothetical protein
VRSRAGSWPTTVGLVVGRAGDEQREREGGGVPAEERGQARLGVLVERDLPALGSVRRGALGEALGRGDRARPADHAAVRLAPRHVEEGPLQAQGAVRREARARRIPRAHHLEHRDASRGEQIVDLHEPAEATLHAPRHDLQHREPLTDERVLVLARPRRVAHFFGAGDEPLRQVSYALAVFAAIAHWSAA